MSRSSIGVAWQKALPDKAIAPSNLLAEELEYRGLTVAAVVTLMHWQDADVQALVDGRHAMTAAAAAALDRALGIDAQLWMRLQTAYEADLALLGTQ